MGALKEQNKTETQMSIITGKDLQRLGWSQGRAVGLAKELAEKLLTQGLEKQAVLATLNQIKDDPTLYAEDVTFGPLAAFFIAQQAPALPAHTPDLRKEALPFQTWGNWLIDEATQAQMQTAMCLPVAVAGALMPDAHVGYGLPIGGVLAVENAVIPYAVGVDIACRMMLTVYPEPPDVLNGQFDRFKKALLNQTHFGIGDAWRGRASEKPYHPVLDDEAWEASPFLKSLKDKAQAQIGSSGSGNHFVEWGAFTLEADDAALNLKAGKYVALLSHSGSRGVGAIIANHFTKVAMEKHASLPANAKHLAWLNMDEEAGQAYWLAMNLAGRFAQANHHVIHKRVAQAAGLTPILEVENHHNFAWEESLPDGRQVYVHRKGATPAGKGVLGVIPGSMGDVGYLVRGLGNETALNSASHGAGRQLSRKKAINSITAHERDRYLKERGVTLLSGGLDEAPQAYKPIQEVIAAQMDLVEVVGIFKPLIVRME